jgi:hypothetical protein
LKEEEFFRIALAEIDRQRRRFGRADHARRASELALALVDAIGNKPGFEIHAAAVYDQLADLAYFFPLPDEDERQRFQRVTGHLNEALERNRDDQFALTLKKHVERVAATDLQVRRFEHDTQTRLGNIHARLDKLERRVPADSPLTPALLALRREFHGLTVLGKIIQKQQPGRADWHSVDPADLVLPLLRERGWPEACLQRTGSPRHWMLCSAFVTIALDNLLRNTVEAYGRARLTPPDCPCLITVDYAGHTITLRDWAGGIDPSLGDVFQPYVSAKGVHCNSGLGLTQAREALRVQSDSFTLRLTEPQPEGGAEFQMHLP